MTEPARFAAAEPAAAGSSDAYRPQAERRVELRRMRTVATLLLVLMAAIYLAMQRAPASWVWAPYLRAFAEAGMVGACADWFAVVALFRHPLGLPIPHTAVVSENKRRIGAAMGRFVINNFLSPRVAIARMSSVDFVGLAARWLEDERNAGGCGCHGARHSVRARPLAKSGDRRMGRSCRAARDRGRSRRAARVPWTLDPMGSGSRSDAARPGPRFCRDDARAPQGDHRQACGAKVPALDPQMGRRHDRRQSDQRAQRNLEGNARPDHSWREQAKALIESLIDDLAHDPEMRTQGEALKQEILANPVFAEQAQALREDLETALMDDLPRHAEAIVWWLAASAG